MDCDSLRSGGEPGEGDVEQSISELELENRLQSTGLEHLKSKQHEREPSLTREWVRAEIEHTKESVSVSPDRTGEDES